ncbi:MAG TPA: TolC family protein [Pantanalinema sp.]
MKTPLAMLVAGAMLAWGSLAALAQALPEPPADLTLDQAITKALANNPQLRAARAELSRAEAEADVAKLYPLRSVSANVGVNTVVPPANGLPLPAAGAYVTMNLGDFLSTPLVLKGSEARLQAAREGVRQVSLQVVASTTEAYAGWLSQQKLLVLRQEAIRSTESDVMVVQRLFGKGNASISEVMKARLAVSQSQADLVASEGAYNRAWAILVQQMGDTDWLEKRPKTAKQ